MADDTSDPHAKLEFRVAKAVKKDIRAIVMLYGKSGSGKTYSALRIARGLVGPKGVIGVLDTEHRRGLYYSDDFEYVHAEMKAPYSPARYLQALREFERQGVDCMIVDSLSHIQEGEGGLIEMAEKQGESMKSDSFAKWAKPKAEWKRVRNAFLQSPIHLVFCARAKNPLEPGEGRKMVKGDLVPIVPADFEYEVVISLGIEVDTHQIIPTKLPNQLAGAFPLDQFITEQSGRALAQWLDGQKIVDPAFEALKDEGRAAASQGPAALKNWWVNLGGNNQRRLTEFKDDVLKPLAEKGSAPATQAASGADASTGTPARAESSAPPPKRDEPQARDEPPTPAADDRGESNEFDFDEPAKPAATREPFPEIKVANPPNWIRTALALCDVIDSRPNEAAVIEQHYADLLAQMEKNSARAFESVQDSFKTARES